MTTCSEKILHLTESSSEKMFQTSFKENKK